MRISVGSRSGSFPLLLLILFLSPSHGQEDAGGAAGQTGSVGRQIVPISLFSSFDDALYFFQDGEAVPIQFSRNSRASQVSYAGPDELVLYMRKGSGENVSYEAVAGVRLPSGADRVLLIASTREKPPAGLRFHLDAFDDTLDAHPNGTLRLVNLTRGDVALAFGDEILRAAPGQTANETYEEKNGSVRLQVALQVPRKGSDEWVEVAGKRVQVYPGMRVLVLTYAPRGMQGRAVLEVLRDSGT